MKRLAMGVLMVGSLSLLMAAKSEGGCGVQLQPGDGTSATWDGGTVPTPSATPSPMTCTWLEQDNCWKRIVAKGKACAADVSAQGTFAADRKSCSYPGRGTWQFDGSIDTPSQGNTLIPVVNWRVLDSSGSACMTGRVLAPGKTTLDVQGETVLFENLTLTKYRVTCPDGSTFVNDDTNGDGGANADAGGSSSEVCPAFGALWLQHRTPGILMSCNGTEKRCKLDFWGAAGGEQTMTTCGW